MKKNLSHDHLTMCINGDGTLEFSIDRDPDRIEKAIKVMVRFFNENPEKIQHVIEKCSGHKALTFEKLLRIGGRC